MLCFDADGISMLLAINKNSLKDFYKILDQNLQQLNNPGPNSSFFQAFIKRCKHCLPCHYHYSDNLKWHVPKYFNSCAKS